MSIKVANIRLELGEPEESLPAKIAGRLGLAADAIARAGGSSARASTPAATTTSISPTPPRSSSPRATSPASPEPGRIPDVEPTSPSASTGPSPAPSRCGIGP